MPKMRNTPQTWGTIAIALHWLMALVILGLFGLGFYMVDLTYYDPLYKTLPEIHKGIGILLALVLVLRIAWRLTNPRPAPIAGTTPLEERAASLVHHLFYLLIVVVMFTGYLISTADGKPIDVFGLFSVSATLTSIPEQEDRAGLVHEYLAYGLIALVVLHAAAALKHHFVDRDDTLRRMLGMRASDRYGSDQ
ncbi:MAG: cytochrome b [Gammaproteobacteria bacterium]|nr:cytochrome b [Gammaproteobacteria bacterium]